MKILSKSMVNAVLSNKRNLGLDKAKVVAKATGTDLIVWIDPARAMERRPAWEKAFGKPAPRGRRKRQ